MTFFTIAIFILDSVLKSRSAVNDQPGTDYIASTVGTWLRGSISRKGERKKRQNGEPSESTNSEEKNSE